VRLFATLPTLAGAPAFLSTHAPAVQLPPRSAAGAYAWPELGPQNQLQQGDG
jgi:hypothetical protein